MNFSLSLGSSGGIGIRLLSTDARIAEANAFQSSCVPSAFAHFALPPEAEWQAVQRCCASAKLKAGLHVPPVGVFVAPPFEPEPPLFASPEEEGLTPALLPASGTILSPAFLVPQENKKNARSVVALTENLRMGVSS